MKRSGMSRPTCRTFVPRDQSTFETITTIYYYTPQLQIAAVVRWLFYSTVNCKDSLSLLKSLALTMK